VHCSQKQQQQQQQQQTSTHMHTHMHTDATRTPKRTHTHMHTHSQTRGIEALILERVPKVQVPMVQPQPQQPQQQAQFPSSGQPYISHTSALQRPSNIHTPAILHEYHRHVNQPSHVPETTRDVIAVSICSASISAIQSLFYIETILQRFNRCTHPSQTLLQ